jgi:ubiquinone/menaquinone biosynthesis C-methylase UbiE
MSVAAHLGIDLREYDARIRTFIPDYEEMLDAAAALMRPSARTIVDLGTGTGALAARCAARADAARIVGIDADAAILAAARRRLGPQASFITRSFLRAPVPRADAVVASFALHHVRTRGAKSALYGRIRRALTPKGIFVAVDCYPAADRTLARAQHAAWGAHLERSYSAKRAASLLAAWAKEDVYVPLDAELAMLERNGFDAEIAWRKGAFAVLAAFPRGPESSTS